MKTVASSEQDCLSTLSRYAPLDRLPEAVLDHITGLAATLLGKLESKNSGLP